MESVRLGPRVPIPHKTRYLMLYTDRKKRQALARQWARNAYANSPGGNSLADLTKYAIRDLEHWAGKWELKSMRHKRIQRTVTLAWCLRRIKAYAKNRTWTYRKYRDSLPSFAKI